MLSHHYVISGVQFNTPDGFHLYRDTASFFFFLQLIGHSRAIHSAQSFVLQGVHHCSRKEKWNKQVIKERPSVFNHQCCCQFFLLFAFTITPWEEVAEEVTVGTQVYTRSTFSAQLRELSGHVSPH